MRHEGWPPRRHHDDRHFAQRQSVYDHTANQLREGIEKYVRPRAVIPLKSEEPMFGSRWKREVTIFVGNPYADDSIIVPESEKVNDDCW